MNITIRTMTNASLPQVAQLETVCFSDPWSEESLRSELENETATWLVAVLEDDTIVGYGGLHVLFDEGEIMNIAVSPAYRRAGIGAALLTALLNAAADAEAVFLEVRASNSGAIALYERFGFEKIAVRKNYYRLPTEDAHIMRKEMKK